MQLFYQLYCYNIHDIIKVQSEVVLHELEFFSVPDISNPDMIVKVKNFFTDKDMIKFNGKRKLLSKNNTVKYTEHFGLLGAQFQIHFNEKNVEMYINNIINLSKHVVYVNLVEPILRFMLISRGYVLLHSACMDIDGYGFLLSAPPDTGKTTTVIKCTHKNYRFLSDDMTIIKLPTEAICFPKPMTISAHTFKTAINAASDNNSHNKIGIRIRSLVHSKGGRSFMHKLGDRNVPIFTFNALGQSIIKPPKFKIQDLIESVKIQERTEIKSLYFLEKAEKEEIEKISIDVSLSKAIENSDDAFLFPPYNELINFIRINGKSAKELLIEERRFLEKFLSNIQSYRLKSNNRSWATTLLEITSKKII